MEIPFLSAAGVGIALMALSPADDRAAPAPGEVGLVGAPIYASEAPIPAWGEPVRAEDLTLEGLGQVRDVVTGGAGGAGWVIVSVGGLWGWGAQDVRVSLERLRVVDDAGGEPWLVLDLSAQGAEPALL